MERRGPVPGGKRPRRREGEDMRGVGWEAERT